MNTVTCVISSYNNMPYLRTAVGSVLAQTRKPDEIIVADDGSTDGSREYLRSMHATYPEIKPVFRENNLGVAMNRDLAVRSASSVFVTTLDGDDIYHREKIEKELFLLGGCLESVVYSDVALINENGANSTLLTFTEFSKLNKADQLLNLLYRKLPIPRDMMFSRKLFITSGGYRQHASGLSKTDPLTHLTCQLEDIMNNQDWLRRTAGMDHVFRAMLGRVVDNMDYSSVKLVK